MNKKLRHLFVTTGVPPPVTIGRGVPMPPNQMPAPGGMRGPPPGMMRGYLIRILTFI